tara:strand:- start:56058 stop:56984 length:927 start_codon:yes stop_codon:yes gene_type:complete
MTTSVLENIFTELLGVYENLKAEVLIAEIQENSDVTEEDFVIANQSTFSRPYRRDIIDVDNLLNDNMLTFNLSRNGLYDMLPEGLFHAPQTEKAGSSFSAYRKSVKEEEKEARSFFAPIENEFFLQRLRIESKERELLDNFYNLNDDFLIEFWNIDSEIPESYILKLIKLLPHSYKIAGDLELTRLTMEKVLNEKVTFNKKFEARNPSEENTQKKKSVDNFELGVNSVLATTKQKILSPILEVTIGPISEKKINNYLKKDGVLKFINTFYDYFIPIEIEVETKFIVNNKNGFVLNEDDNPIMGISTQL